MTGRWVVLDVGETLVDETRVWSTWADRLGIPRLTFMAGLGSVIARGGEHRDVFDLFGSTDWEDQRDALEDAYGGFGEADLYPDVRPALDRLLARGYRLAIAANQPRRRTAELRALQIPAEVIVTSEEMGLYKPAPAFFARTLALLGDPEPGEVAYVGDRIDNDVLPAERAGMRAIWLRRGPWGLIQALPPTVIPALVADSLAEVAERIDEAWAGLSASGPSG